MVLYNCSTLFRNIFIWKIQRLDYQLQPPKKTKALKPKYVYSSISVRYQMHTLVGDGAWKPNFRPSPFMCACTLVSGLGPYMIKSWSSRWSGSSTGLMILTYVSNFGRSSDVNISRAGPFTPVSTLAHIRAHPSPPWGQAGFHLNFLTSVLLFCA